MMKRKKIYRHFSSVILGLISILGVSAGFLNESNAFKSAAAEDATSSWIRCSSVSDLTSGGTFIIGYEATANSGVIVPMQNSGTATLSAAGYLYSGATSGSTGSDTINMSSVTDTDSYEVTIASSTIVDGAITIKVGDSYVGNKNTSNNLKLFSDESTTTAFTPTVGNNDVFTFKIAANATYTTLQYNSGSPRFAVYSGTQKNVVVYKKANRALTSIAISGTPNKLAYIVGETFDPTGLVVTATYSDSSTEDVTSSATFYGVDNALTLDTTSFETYATYLGKESNHETYTITVSKKGYDILTYSSIGVTGTTYKSWADIQDESNSTYAGITAGGNSSIQLNNKNNAGIMNTISSGVVSKIIVSWNSKNTSGRILNIYGKNTAYTVTSELYSEETQGTLIGQIKFGTSTELDIEVANRYSYFGIVANDGAIYLDSIKIYWDTTATVTKVSLSPEGEFDLNAGEEKDFTVSITGNNLTGNEIANVNFESASELISCDKTGTVKNGDVIKVSAPSNMPEEDLAELYIAYSDEIQSSTITINAYPLKELTSIAITTKEGESIKDEYYEGDTFDATNAVITATYSDGSTRDVTSLTTWPTDPLTLTSEEEVEIQNVTASYAEDNVTKTADVEIMVSKVIISKLTWNLSSASGGFSFNIFDKTSFDFSKIGTLKVEYNDTSKNKTLTLKDLTCGEDYTLSLYTAAQSGEKICDIDDSFVWSASTHNGAYMRLTYQGFSTSKTTQFNVIEGLNEINMSGNNIANSDFNAQKSILNFVGNFFATSFNTTCDNQGDSFSVESVISEYDALKNSFDTYFSSLSESEVTDAKNMLKYATSKNWNVETCDPLQKALYRYDVIYSKYGTQLEDYLNRFSDGGAMQGQTYDASGTLVDTNNNYSDSALNLTACLFAGAALILIGGYIVISKRKEL